MIVAYSYVLLVPPLNTLLAQSLIWLCAERLLVSLQASYAKVARADAPFATATFGNTNQLGFAMSATTGAHPVDASYAKELVLKMQSTALSAASKRKIETDAQL